MLSSHGISLFLNGRFFGMDGKSVLSTIWGSSSSSISTNAFVLLFAVTSVGAADDAAVDDVAVAVSAEEEEEDEVFGLRAAMMAFRRASFAASGSLLIFRFTLGSVSL